MLRLLFILKSLGVCIIFFSACAAGVSTAEKELEAPAHVSPMVRTTARASSAVTPLHAVQNTVPRASAGAQSLQHTAQAAPAAGKDYVLGPDDLVEIEVFQAEELKRTVRITSQGYVNLPLVGAVKASGLTVAEFENELCKVFEEYLQEPSISVFIKEYRSQRVTVLGAVKRPQVFTVSGQKYLLDIISLAEGLSEDAGDICSIQRGRETMVISLDQLLRKGDSRLNIPLYAGDVVHIPKGGIVFVSGAVAAPGSFTMQGTVTLTQAIAMAKDPLYEADKAHMRIYRDTGKEARDIIDVDYDAILEKKVADIALRDKDVVVVPKSGTRAFFKGFVNTLRGFISFGKGW